MEKDCECRRPRRTGRFYMTAEACQCGGLIVWRESYLLTEKWLGYRGPLVTLDDGTRRRQGVTRKWRRR